MATGKRYMTKKRLIRNKYQAQEIFVSASFLDAGYRGELRNRVEEISD